MGEKYIYVIGSTRGPFKVGVATSVKARLCELQIASPTKLLIIQSYAVPAHLAFVVEREAHQDLRDHKVRGEWFSAPARKINATVTARVVAVWKILHEREAAKEVERLECQRLVEDVEAAAKAAIIQVAGVELVHRITQKEYFAEQAKIAWEKDAPRRAFLQRMTEGKRKKADAKRVEDARLAASAEKLQDWFVMQRGEN